MKKIKITFWVATGIIFVLEGVLTALNFNSEMSKVVFAHLGYPDYFAAMLSVFKILGALALILPQVSGRIKEWAYAGFTFDFISAFVSMWVIDGIGKALLVPIVFFAILAVSYKAYHKLHPVVVA